MNSGIRQVVVAALALCAGVAAQRDLAAWPADALRAAARLPVVEGVDGGVRVLVREAGGAAVADADVFVVDLAAVDAATLGFLQAHFGRDRHLVLASVHGTRYRTGADGTVHVALPERGAVAACATGASGSAVAVAGAVAVTLDSRVEVYVEVFGADGRPAVGVPVSVFAGNSNGFSSVVCTDRSGRARVQARRAVRLEVRALIAGRKPVAIEVPAGYLGKRPELLRLDLPPLGRVHTLGRLGPHVALTLSAGSTGVPPTRVDDDGAWFDHVALDTEVAATLEQRFREPVRIAGPGPTAVGGIATLDVSGAAGAAAMLTAKGRLLDADGKPVADARLWACVLGEGVASTFLAPTTDAAGRFELAIDTKGLGDGEAALIVAPRPHLVSGDTQIASAPLAADPRGAVELGELRLQDEPVLAQGRVVDLEGKPLAAVQVVVRQVVGARLVARPPWWETRTAADGTFTLRGFDPRRGALRIGVEGKNVLAEDVAAGPGDLDVVVRAARPGRLRVTFADGAPSWLQIELQKQEPGSRPRRIGGEDAKVWPGRYDLVMKYLGRPLMRIDGIEVRSGTACDDPRIRGVDWRRYVQEFMVQLQDTAGAPLSGHVTVSNGQDGGRKLFATDERGYVLVPFLEGLGVVAWAPDCRPARVLQGFEPVSVRLAPRARLRVAIPRTADVPDHLVVRENGFEIARDLVDGEELRPAGSGTITLVFGDRGPGVGPAFRELWRQEVRVRDDDLLQVLTLDPEGTGK
ncbi:MAG: hypothetical protein U1E73_03465 [Planctomycetota bacterium]